jgi:helicase
MNIEDLPIPERLIQQYHSLGITTLYPPQINCVEKGVFEGNNLLIAIPTASGKTLIAEMAMHHHVARGGKCLYIVPLKALASEKFDDFSKKETSIGIATGDLDRRDEYLGRNHIVIATSEKVDSLLRNAARWLSEITLLVVDEVHLLDSVNRGATLEMVITKLRSLNPGMQIIALSATIGNPDMLGGWLDAGVVTSEWRPVELREGIYYRGSIYFEEGERQIPTPSKHDDINLCLDTVEEGGQSLVFVSSRRNAEGFAKRMALALAMETDELAEYSQKLERYAETEMGKVLAACVRRGVAFHHAGLKAQQRALVEKGFRKGYIKVITSTPTLAAGLNLPARRVIIRDYLRFQSGEGMVPIPVREYRQMAGRAGRPRLDPYGESVLIAHGKEAMQELFISYIEAPAEDVRSRCASESALMTHILSLIATGFTTSREGLIQFLDRSFYAFEHSKGTYLSRIVDRVQQFLLDAEMITDLDGHISATGYGHLVSRLYIDPRSAEQISGTLRTRETFSEIGILQLLCSTPDMFTLYIRKGDMGMLDQYISLHEDELWMDFGFNDGEEYFRSLKTALLLNAWIDEAGEETICTRFGVNPGDIYSAVDGINWLVHAARRLSSLIAPEYTKAINELELRMRHGVKRELLPLIRLRGIGRVRARRLFNNNITDIADLRSAGLERVTHILGRGTARAIFAQLEEEGGQISQEDEVTGSENQSTLDAF